MTLGSTTPDVDHLVVMAATLQEGALWCRQALGVDPATGGEHPLMGTHNRLLNLSSATHPRAHLEIIALNPKARPALAAGARRWFDMDDAALRAQVARDGPQLIHWVASVPDIAAAHAALAERGVDRGDVVTAGRPTPFGLLEWRITLRPDGQRLMDGCLPTLIQWGERHPCHSLPESGVALQSLALEHPQPEALGAACAAIGLRCGPVARAGAPRIRATLSTPRGTVPLQSQPLETLP
ncbi:VOC family protein [Paracidovorax anthurii]|uniref:Glyoxalase-like protein n=1 Tax=Paracidovorax anthurii TaxID=78229 RepID=A0A328YPY2_9BURK|nr:VOC family protein [Paracidovorax anthurii]RAR75879.1 glyoxalase-like protein [Paracidovorax anthurii]